MCDSLRLMTKLMAYSITYRHTILIVHASCLSEKGLLCKYLFFIMKTLKMKDIPQKYIKSRWMKTHRTVDMHTVFPKVSNGNNHLFTELCKMIGHVKGKSDLNESLYIDLKVMTDKYLQLGQPLCSSRGKE